MRKNKNPYLQKPPRNTKWDNRLRSRETQKVGLYTKTFRNPAPSEEVQEFGRLLGVTFTKPMRLGTLMKLKRQANSGSESQDDRMDFWRQVSVYTDHPCDDLYFGEGEN